MNKVLSRLGEDVAVASIESNLKERRGVVSKKDTTNNLIIQAETTSEYVAKLSERARREHGERLGIPDLNQNDYAKLIGVSKATVQTWEGGHNVPKAIWLSILAWHIGASADEVVADLIQLEEKTLVTHIPKGLRDQQFSIPRFLDSLGEMPLDVLLQVHHQVLRILEQALAKGIEKERKRDINGES